MSEVISSFKSLRAGSQVFALFMLFLCVILLQTTQPTSGGPVTVVTTCCANCIQTSRNGGPIYSIDLIYLSILFCFIDDVDSDYAVKHSVNSKLLLGDDPLKLIYFYSSF